MVILQARIEGAVVYPWWEHVASFCCISSSDAKLWTLNH